MISATEGFEPSDAWSTSPDHKSGTLNQAKLRGHNLYIRGVVYKHSWKSRKSGCVEHIPHRGGKSSYPFKPLTKLCYVERKGACSFPLTPMIFSNLRDIT